MSKIIHISYFLNPYCFYFKFDDDLHDDNLKCLEDELSKYAHNEIKKQNSDEKPISIAIGDLVAAYIIPWGKWARAVVRCDLENLKYYELWAIDHGKLFRTAYKNVIALPEQFNKQDTHPWVHRGSIYGVSPAKLDFNLDTCKSEHQPTENWTEKANVQCRELLRNEDITQILFETKAQRGKCFFGDIRIETTKALVNIADTLKLIDEAIDVDLEPELDQIEAKYRKFHLSEAKHDDANGRTEFTNGRSVRQLLHTVNRNNQIADQQSVIQSTIVPSEIDGGATRHKRGVRLIAPSIDPSCVQSTIVSSEIDGGATRNQTKRHLRIAPPSNLTNGNAQMSAKPNRQLATNYVNANGSNARRHMPPMPAGYEPDMDSFRKYNS